MRLSRRRKRILAWVLVALAAATLVVAIVLQLPSEIRGEVTGADLEMGLSHSPREISVRSGELQSLRLPIYELDLDGLVGGTAEYKETGSSEWRSIPTPAWVSVSPKPEGDDDSPGIWLNTNARTSHAELRLKLSAGALENVEIRGGETTDGNTVLGLRGRGLTIGGDIRFSDNAASEGPAVLVVQPTSGSLLVRYRTVQSPEMAALGQIGAVRVSMDPARMCHVDLHPTYPTDWGFRFKHLGSPNGGWTLNSSSPLMVSHLRFQEISTGKITIAESTTEEFTPPSLVEFLEAKLRVHMPVRVEITGVTVAIDGLARDATANDRHIGRRALYRNMSMIFTALFGIAAGLVSFWSNLLDVLPRWRPRR